MTCLQLSDVVGVVSVVVEVHLSMVEVLVSVTKVCRVMVVVDRCMRLIGWK